MGLIALGGSCVRHSELLSRLGSGRDSGVGGSRGGGGRAPTTLPPVTVTVDGKDAREDNCSRAGNPIIFSTGNKVEPELDFRTSGEMPLHLLRTYNHYWRGAGLFGKNWISNFDYKLTFGTTALNGCYPRPGGGSCGIGSNTVIYAWRPDGGTIKFIRRADGVFYEDKAQAIATIQVQADGSFWLQTDQGDLEIYSSAGYVKIIRNLHNVDWTFTYAAGNYPVRVTHTSGRYVEFVWTSGQLTAVRDPGGSYYGFAYAANFFGAGLHRLASTSKPAAPATAIAYHYELASDTTALTGKSINGARYSTFTYDANGYATSSAHNGLNKHSFAYTPGAAGRLTVLVTNPLGKKSTHVFQDGKSVSVTGHPSTYCPGTSYALTEYDANGYPSMTSDFNNNKTSYTYNAKGQLIQLIEGFGTSAARSTGFEWWGAAYGHQLMRKTVSGVAVE